MKAIHLKSHICLKLKYFEKKFADTFLKFFMYLRDAFFFKIHLFDKLGWWTFSEMKYLMEAII